MKKEPVGIGILGCGNVAAIHAEAIRHVPGLRLAAVCSRSSASARSLGERFDVAWHTDFEQFLADPSLQAVSICTPSGTHSELGCAAARHGKHVLVEKPIDVSLAAADSLIRACEHAGVCLGVSLQSRFLDAPRILKDAIDAGRLGTPVAASAYIKWYRSPDYYRSASWRGTLALDGGGALINQAIHTVDLLRWMMGPVENLSALSARRFHSQIEGEDALVAALRFRNGALGVIEAGTSMFPGFKRRLEITGTEGTAMATILRPGRCVMARRIPRLLPGRLPTARPIPWPSTSKAIAASRRISQQRSVRDGILWWMDIRAGSLWSSF